MLQQQAVTSPEYIIAGQEGLLFPQPLFHEKKVFSWVSSLLLKFLSMILHMPRGTIYCKLIVDEK